MREVSHISADTFFGIIQTRLFRYMKAMELAGGCANIASAIHYNVNKLKSLNSQDNFCGKGFWGYGLNCISNGREKWCFPDILDIEKMNIVNKHREPFRHLQVLTFKVEGRYLYLSNFSIDSCQVGIVSAINQKYDLCNFDTARLVTNGQKTYVEFIFMSIPEPISFQVEDYYFPSNLSGDALSKYYIDTMKEIATHFIVEKNESFEPIPNFIDDLVGGIKQLQNQGKRAECIRKMVDENKRDEGGFRDFFQVILEAKGYTTEAEPQTSVWKIDLKVMHPKLTTKIVEFKGWWNDDKKNIINQLHRYLTEFDDEGYVFIINHTSRNIIDKFKDIVCNVKMNYVADSWEEIRYRNSGFSYYQSKHQSTRLKIIYHFIFSVC